MSHEDPYRQDPGAGRDRGAYTPPTDEELPFRRGGGGYDARRSGAGGPPVTLMVSAGVLLLLIIVVVIYYRAGARGSEDAPPAIGTPVGALKVEAAEDAQPIDPAEGIAVYDEAEPLVTAPTYVPPPEAVQPGARPAEAATPPPARPAERPTVAAGGNSSVQIGAFSTPGLADSEYGRVVGRYGQFTEGAVKRVQEVTSSSGSTLYRTTVSGLSREQAQGLCDAIKASGGDCIVR
ncbi:MAG: SPOR domain-containing protein [Brevundimonas sp.]|uniref:SPOR domain-containing protein n=1 Tax=Brevundimonas sp. TaxID=1871086 RepID=UPI002735FAEC|nr:SPOR domain-containing protein [Brevundimonas sp.]MDP3377611.1 SPOR domain-containing protein [Brevundimonas sp.]